MDVPRKMRLTSKFEGVTISKQGIPICKCGEKMARRVKNAASEPFTDDDQFWRCPQWGENQCPSIIWFNEFDKVKPQLGAALEHAGPQTPKKKKQNLIDGYLTPSTHGKPNELLERSGSSERLDDRLESKQATPSNGKRPATMTFEQTTPTKKKKMEAQTLVTPGSRGPVPAHGQASSVSNIPRMLNESPCPIRDTWNAGDKENWHPSSASVYRIHGRDVSADGVVILPIPEGSTEIRFEFK